MPASLLAKTGIASLALCLCAPAIAAPPSDEAAVRAATEAIYASYVAGEIGNDAKLTVSFAKAWQHALGPGGAMDYDPFCECQDFGDFTITIKSVAIAGDTARVAVVLSNFGTPTAKRLVFRKVAGLWLLDDMSLVDTASLKQDMASGPAGAYAMGE